jgi:antitoxin component of RelBE/YafQ-DinJ toxin-antitoxin module
LGGFLKARANGHRVSETGKTHKNTIGSQAQLWHKCYMTEVFRVRLERDLIRRAHKIAEEIGTSPGEVVRLVFTQMVKRRAIPFPLQADPPEGEVLSPAERRSKMWDAMNEGRPKAR